MLVAGCLEWERWESATLLRPVLLPPPSQAFQRNAWLVVARELTTLACSGRFPPWSVGSRDTGRRLAARWACSHVWEVSKSRRSRACAWARRQTDALW